MTHGAHSNNTVVLLNHCLGHLG
uniref:Uncharacterized protein n=1 Tax=Arundo donax TaxID=35708 RepID=A0A0A8ZZM8_ARUDO